MNKKILLFSHDPGGANILIPLVKPLKAKRYQVRLFGLGPALKKYSEFGLKGKNILNFIDNIKIPKIKSFLKKENPKLILTGTSAKDKTENHIWKAAADLRIPSFAILYQWLNYKKRFPNLPTKIFVMDKFAKEEIIKEGFDKNKIIITGQPFFEILLKKKNQKFRLNKLRSSLNLSSKDFLITYASEPISQDYPKSYWGYTEQSILREIYETIKKITPLSTKKISLVIKLHPRETLNNYKKIINYLKKNSINIIVDKDHRPLDLILASNLICGMSSMFLIEAVILGKPIISVQIGLKGKNPFVLDRKRIVKSILTPKALYKELKTAIVENKLPQYNFSVIKNPVKKVIDQIERYL